MIGRLNHVAIAVRDIAKASAVYRDTLGAEVSAKVAQPDHGIRLCYIDAGKPDEAVGIRRHNLFRVIFRVNVR